MEYQRAKDAFLELQNFEGKATFKGEETKIQLFVLLPKVQMNGFDLKEFLALHQATGSFEIEGGHTEEGYTILGINTGVPAFTNDTDYLLKLLVW